MVVLIMGFSKSGTTMTARALHKAGINFGIEQDGKYPGQPYEEEVGCSLIMQQIGAPKKDSLFLPENIVVKRKEVEQYCMYRYERNRNWGFKFPYITFVYQYWKQFLPDHIAIALKRSPESVITHYTKNRKKFDMRKAKRVWKVQAEYNELIDSYKIPVFHFEKILAEGFGEVEKLFGIKIPDVRNYQGIGDGNKYYRRKK